MKAYTLFTLKRHVSAAEYRQWALTEVRPRMLRMPSVLAFRDYQVFGTMDDSQSPYTFVEEIEITTPAEFERDNAEGDGAVLAEEWQSRVADVVVIYCRDLEDVASSDTA